MTTKKDRCYFHPTVDAAGSRIVQKTTAKHVYRVCAECSTAETLGQDRQAQAPAGPVAAALIEKIWGDAGMVKAALAEAT